MKNRTLWFLFCIGLCLPALHVAHSFFAKKGEFSGAVKSLWVELPKEEAERVRVNLPSLAPLIENAQNAVLVVSTEMVVKQNQPQLPPGYDRGPFKDFFRFFGPPPGQQPEYRTRGQGSGFIIHPSGYALTNHHVVEGATTINVKVGEDLQEYKAKVIGSDMDTDVALIKIESDKNNWPVIPLGSSKDIRVGDFAVAIGNPLGLELSASMGIVSARGRRDIHPSGRNGLYDFLQIDAPINPGNSGGPSLNLAGEAIAINTAISASGQGIAFAIPIDQVKQILPQLKEVGHVTRSWIGVNIHNVTPDVAKAMGLAYPHGALVREVVPKGPAAKAGIEPGDIITQFDGKPVKDATSLQSMAGLSGAGRSIPLTVHRDKKTLTLKVTLEAMPRDDKTPAPVTSEGKSTGIKDLGLSVVTLDERARRQLKLEKDLKGVRITAIEEGSVAEAANMMLNDIIVKVNEHNIGSANDLQNVLKKIESGGIMKIRLRRGSSLIFIALPKP